ncbi:MBL fold metallo-hydrolase [Vulcanococcus sp.]|uniref:MBL fold metallo-hydrolase n=1 Tax=Vulcanococcus sp. TaxID=2856995 RepID=UPI003235C519
MSVASTQPLPEGRPPRQVQEHLWLFAPNRDCMGGSAWWLETADGGGVLVDCPGLTQANLSFLSERPAGQIVLTSREGHGRLRRLQSSLGWPVFVQEQEAYLLPGLAVETYGSEQHLAPGLRLRWTPGPTPGSAVLLADAQTDQPAVLFCGRLLSPVAPGQALPLRTRRSFHWGRWIQSLQDLQAWIPADPALQLASGAGLGALRGEALIASFQEQLTRLDLAALRDQPAP